MTLEPPAGETGPWGFYDTVDNCWLGNRDAPILHGNYELAKVGEAILNERFGAPLRIQLREFREAKLFLRDEVTPKRGFNRLERGQ